MTAKTRANFKTDRDVTFADNTAGDISALDLRSETDHLADSALFPEDQSAIKTAYEANANTNAYTDAEKTKLAGIGTGADVVGPASAVTGRIASFNGTTGKLIQDSGILAADVLTTSGGATVTLSDGSGTVLVSTQNTLTADDTVYIDSNGSLASGPTKANVEKVALEYCIDGGGSAITTGVKGTGILVPVGMTITSVYALADQTGSIVVDVWKDTYANFPPTDVDSITASAPVTISSATKSLDSTLTGWTTSIAANDILYFNVDSATTIQNVTIVIIGTLS